MAVHTIVINHHVVDAGHGIYCFTSDDPRWTEAMTDLWNKLCNEEDRPVQRNTSNQMPMCKIYEDKSLCLDRYIGVSELCGTELLGKMSFGDFDEGDWENALYYGSCNTETLLTTLNVHLLNLGFRLKIE